MVKQTVIGRCLRPALARFRRSTRYAVLGLAAIAIAGCSEVAKETKDAVAFEGMGAKAAFRGLAENEWRVVMVFTDPETGCEYLINDGKKEGGMTIRIGSDGRPICSEGK